MRRLALALALGLLVPVAAASSHLPRVDRVRVDAGNQVLRIDWDPAPGPGVAGYAVFVWSEGRLVQQINASAPPATFRGVNDRAYAVQVAAVDAGGTPGPPSAPVAATPTLRHDQTYLAAGLIVVWLGIWGYALVLSRIERDLRLHLDRIQREKERLGEPR